MMEAIAVLGCGPAGLMAAQAVALTGGMLVLFSEKAEPSKLGGAQFLHKPIPGINDEEPDALITYRVRGDEETYRRKVYGEEPVPFTSFANVKDGETQPAWNLIETYEKLWDKFEPHINVGKIGPTWFDEMGEFTHVFSSIPLPAICKARAGLVPAFHHFHSQSVNICTRQFADDIPDNTIVYDGTMDRRWYRASRIFDVHGTEWSAHTPPPPVGDIIKATKPVATTCDCHPQVTRVGRNGTWTKGMLTHDALVTALKTLLPPREV